jgi:hypothetical protein
MAHEIKNVKRVIETANIDLTALMSDCEMMKVKIKREWGYWNGNTIEYLREVVLKLSDFIDEYHENIGYTPNVDAAVRYLESHKAIEWLHLNAGMAKTNAERSQAWDEAYAQAAAFCAY